MDRKIIIALIIIVLIALAGLISFSSGIKSDTQINFLTGSSLKNGDKIQFELRDAQGNVLANQEINITFSGNGEKQNFTITTDDKGQGVLILKDENAGNYSVSVSYGGDDKHNGCSANQKIKIVDGTSQSSSDSTHDVSSQSTSDTSYSYTSSSSSGSNYNSESNERVDSNGKIVGGQNDGLDAEYIKNNQPNIVDGSLE